MPGMLPDMLPEILGLPERPNKNEHGAANSAPLEALLALVGGVIDAVADTQVVMHFYGAFVAIALVIPNVGSLR